MKHSYLTESHTDSVPEDEMVCALPPGRQFIASSAQRERKTLL